MPVDEPKPSPTAPPPPPQIGNLERMTPERTSNTPNRHPCVPGTCGSSANSRCPRASKGKAALFVRHGSGEVGLVDDVVAIEHRPRLPAAEPHDFALRHAGSAQIPCGRAPEIVDKPTLQPSLPGGARPRWPEALNTLAPAVEDREAI